MLTLTEFLLARIAEDEAVARDFIGEGPWQAWAVRDVAGPRRDDEYAQLTVGAARVLAECEAKRRIVELHEHDLSGQYGSDKPGCWECDHDRDYELIPRGWCRTLRLLALPYGDHDDYLEEWKP